MKINIYRCDVCGAHSYERQNDSIQYIGHGCKNVFEHVCEDCIYAFETFLSQMKDSEEERIIFVDAEDGHLKFCDKVGAKMDEVIE